MSDIAERLRRGVQYWTPPGRYTDVPNVTVTDATMKEAADEIDRLREVLEDSQSLLVAMLHEARPATEIEAQIVANRAALSSPAGSAAEAWQPIETAPKDGTPILITRPTRHQTEEGWHVVRWDDDWWTCHDGQFDAPLRGSGPTHWQPLPAPPAIEGGQP